MYLTYSPQLACSGTAAGGAGGTAGGQTVGGVGGLPGSYHRAVKNKN